MNVQRNLIQSSLVQPARTPQPPSAVRTLAIALMRPDPKLLSMFFVQKPWLSKSHPRLMAKGWRTDQLLLVCHIRGTCKATKAAIESAVLS